MPFLIVVACLISERFLLSYEELRRPVWCERYFDWHQSLPLTHHWRYGYGGLLTIITPPLLLIGGLQSALSDTLWGIPGILLSTLVLLFSLGPRDLDSQVTRLLSARVTGDLEQADSLTKNLLLASEPPETNLASALGAAVLVESNRRLFAVLLWFILLGPVGAAAYRLIDLTAQLALHQNRYGLFEATRTALHIIDWLPARLTVASFALAGCFEPALRGWRSCAKERYRSDAAAIVSCAGVGALQLDAHASDTDFVLRTAMALVWRSLMLWIALLGLITLSGWMS